MSAGSRNLPGPHGSAKREEQPLLELAAQPDIVNLPACRDSRIFKWLLIDVRNCRASRKEIAYNFYGVWGRISAGSGFFSDQLKQTIIAVLCERYAGHRSRPARHHRHSVIGLISGVAYKRPTDLPFLRRFATGLSLSEAVRKK